MALWESLLSTRPSARAIQTAMKAQGVSIALATIAKLTN
jgi:hypothetical protein